MCSDDDSPTAWICQLCNTTLHGLDVANHLTSVIQDGTPCWCRHHPFWCANEEFRTHHLFQFSERPAQSRLGDEEFLGGTNLASMLFNG